MLIFTGNGVFLVAAVQQPSRQSGQPALLSPGFRQGGQVANKFSISLSPSFILHQPRLRHRDI
jgi:hypothetical protein